MCRAEPSPNQTRKPSHPNQNNAKHEEKKMIEYTWITPIVFLNGIDSDRKFWHAHVRKDVYVKIH